MSSSSPASTSSSSSTTLRTATSSTYGTYLVDAAGEALYVLSSDPPNTSTCSGACASAWPPLVASGTPTVASGVVAADVGTITRSSGQQQVTYDHHPLYTFVRDSAPGQTNGEGVVAFGGTWMLISPSGNPIAPKMQAGAQASGSLGGSTY